MNNNLTTIINVKEKEVRVMRINNENYISLTDIAKYENNDDPSGLIKQWMSNKDSFDYYGLWEELHNPYFNSVEFHLIKNNLSGRNRFLMNPTKWKKLTNAIGIIPSSGKYSIGTFAHPDIAFEFASWLSPEFKLYLITEFQRLKKNESYKNKIDWHESRILTKVNYLVHTNSIKENIVPTLTEKQKRFVYAEEADVLNVSLFGMTAKEWRDNNRELSKNGNIRDNADLLHLIILNNLEVLNASMIENNISQNDRLIKLNEIARKQMTLLQNNKSIDKLKHIEDK
ncbi:MAG: KilA-N domain-containing protein [Bacilli bacterium]|nr:KilA-N domain-containing protein [Bacilli bacterium]